MSKTRDIGKLRDLAKTYSLQGTKNGRIFPYFDPFTSKTAIFKTRLEAEKIKFMLFAQQDLILEVVEN